MDGIGSLGLVEYRAPYGANKSIKYHKMWKSYGSVFTRSTSHSQDIIRGRKKMMKTLSSDEM